MTTETEKEFFKAFGIKPKQDEYCYHECKIYKLKDIPCDNKSCQYYRIKYDYPEITDRILLELIVINNENAPAVGDTLAELRNQVLYQCIKYKKLIYDAVRKLFGVEV